MISSDRLFCNLFDEFAITPVRLANFAQDTLGKLTAAENPNFAHIIEQLTAPLTVLQKQLGIVDTSVTTIQMLLLKIVVVQQWPQVSGRDLLL